MGMAKRRDQHKEPITGVADRAIRGNSYVGRKALPAVGFLLLKLFDIFI